MLFSSGEEMFLQRDPDDEDLSLVLSHDKVDAHMPVALDALHICSYGVRRMMGRFGLALETELLLGDNLRFNVSQWSRDTVRSASAQHCTLHVAVLLSAVINCISLPPPELVPLKTDTMRPAADLATASDVGPSFFLYPLRMINSATTNY